MSTAASQALLPTILLCTGGMCGHKLWLFVFFFHFVWLYDVTFFCFILVAQKSCCLIRSTPSLPTGTRMYNLTMSLENTPRAHRNLAFFSWFMWIFWLPVSYGSELCWRKTCAPTAASPSTVRPRWSWKTWTSTVMHPASKWARYFTLSSLANIRNLRWLKSAEESIHTKKQIVLVNCLILLSMEDNI